MVTEVMLEASVEQGLEGKSEVGPKKDCVCDPPIPTPFGLSGQHLQP